MTKTPEQMAEEYCNQDEVACAAINRDAEDLVKDAFIAGYKAAKDEKNSPEKLDSCEHILDMEKMVDVNSSNNSNGWISVKERLPEVGQRVLIYNPLEYVSIVMADYYNTTRPFFDHITLDDIHLNIYPDEDKQLYWMPLPKPPEDK